jgi:hypothetical protein
LIGLIAYGVVITRVCFFIRMLATYRENLRATGFFDVSVEHIGALNAAKDLGMDLSLNIVSANGTHLSYNASYFTISAYERSFNEKGLVINKNLPLTSCDLVQSERLPFKEDTEYFSHG